MRKGGNPRPGKRPHPDTQWVPLSATDRGALEQFTARVETLTRFVREVLLTDDRSAGPSVLRPPARARR